MHEFLAPCIYEGEGEMLGMAFFKSLVKHHGKVFFEPIGRTLSELGTAKPNPLNPRHAWALRKPLSTYAKWWVGHHVSAARWSPLPMSDPKLAEHTKFAQRYLSQSGMRISTTMRTFQLKLADRQCRMSALSLDIQNAVVMLVTSLYAKASNDPVTRAAADTVCRELQLKISGGKASNADFRQVTELGSQIASQGWSELDGVASGEIMMPYK
ncbi:Isovaleryl-CoA dehydrogenase [Rhodopirellula maiorica SM1]|uniref:Isovaleryl-CoA dehydrogenase n=1 Tax=Rhodopirellula maiorica SM1 TaxID=1265738 RepID=M5RTB5_9BACT|nr:Isovaleryl-CoA dehydrogenase [Rhodopirellula maiorica SM1]